MELHEPRAVYTAATNVEAHLIKILLTEAGLDAFVSEDVSTEGVSWFGTLAGIHRPQVWVSQADQARAEAIIARYEDANAERRLQAGADDATTEGDVEVVCEECGEESLFPSTQRGTVQDCPRCGAFVDVGEIDASGPFWSEEEPEDDE